MSPILSLLDEISSAAQALDSYTRSSSEFLPLAAMKESNGTTTNGHHEVKQSSDSLRSENPLRDLPSEVEAQRCALEDATHKLQNITRGPGAMIYEHLYRVSSTSASWRLAY